MMKPWKVVILWTILIILVISVQAAEDPLEEHGVKLANRCEACKIMATELQEKLSETGKTSEVIHTGYSIDAKAKSTPYARSELRLVESIEGICDKILEYNIHKERTDSTRFAKGMSQTFKTLHGLVDKGVKVDLGMPMDLWDNPSVEITAMKSQCEAMLEEHEDAIENWYWKLQDKISLMDHLCRNTILEGEESSCLDEKLKGDDGVKTEL